MSKILTWAALGLMVVSFAACKGKAPAPEPAVNILKANLMQLIPAQEAYASAHDGAYFSGILSKGGESFGSFTLSPGVRIVIVSEGAGWSATAAGVEDETHTCAVFVHTEAVKPPATLPETVGCN